MSNTFNGRIYIVDTATPVTGGGGNAITSDSVVISKIRWVSASAAAHHARVTDINQNVLWTSVASGANFIEESSFDDAMMGRSQRTLNGIRVVSLSSGILYLHRE